jgi:hypothetical protein
MEENKIVIYQTEDGQTQIDVRLENDTVWLTQAQMAELFQSSRTNILEHIQHIYEDEELEESSTCRKFRQVRQEGKRMVTREIPMYNLDLIISVGYRVNSKRGVKFRQWANRVLKEYLVKGYAVNKKIRREQIAELRQLVQMVGRTIQNQQLEQNDENQALFDIVVDYTYALDTLDDYDYQRLRVGGPRKRISSMPPTRMRWRLFVLCVTSSETVHSSVMRKTTVSKAPLVRYTRPLAVKNSIPA